jgi:pilus assembly protein Flp/PilA
VVVTKNRQNNHRKELREMLYSPKEKGQGLVEYALILVLVAVVVIVILALLGPAIGNVFSNIVTNI